MSTSDLPPNGSDIVILDSSKWSLLLRRAWWGNRLLLYMLFFPASTVVALLLGYPFQITPDRADILLRPSSFYGLSALVVSGVAFWHIGRTSFHVAPAFAGLWLAYLIAVLLSLFTNECVRDPTSLGCSSAIGGMAIEHAIWVVASAWFAATWVLISRATIRVPKIGQSIPLFRTVVESEGQLGHALRIGPSLLTGLAMLPAVGVLVLLHWKGYPEAQRALFPATKMDEAIGLTTDRSLIQLLVLAAYKNYGPWPYIIALIPSIIDAVILLLGYRLARRIALAWSGRFWSIDRTPGILLLRSFSDDLIRVRPTSILKRLTMGKMRLEEALGRELFSRGTLIAIGQPGERLPKLGAYRIYLDDETWQPTVLAQMNSSALLVVIGGTTKWVRWELDQISGSPNRSKLIYVLPPGTAHERMTRLVLFADAMRLSAAERSAIENFANQLLAICTLEDGRLCLCTGVPRHESDFRLAVYIAILAKFYRAS